MDSRYGYYTRDQHNSHLPGTYATPHHHNNSGCACNQAPTCCNSNFGLTQYVSQIHPYGTYGNRILPGCGCGNAYTPVKLPQRCHIALSVNNPFRTTLTAETVSFTLDETLPTDLFVRPLTIESFTFDNSISTATFNAVVGPDCRHPSCEIVSYTVTVPVDIAFTDANNAHYTGSTELVVDALYMQAAANGASPVYPTLQALPNLSLVPGSVVFSATCTPPAILCGSAMINGTIDLFSMETKLDCTFPIRDLTNATSCRP